MARWEDERYGRERRYGSDLDRWEQENRGYRDERWRDERDDERGRGFMDRMRDFFRGEEEQGRNRGEWGERRGEDWRGREWGRDYGDRYRHGDQLQDRDRGWREERGYLGGEEGGWRDREGGYGEPTGGRWYRGDIGEEHGGRYGRGWDREYDLRGDRDRDRYGERGYGERGEYGEYGMGGRGMGGRGMGMNRGMNRGMGMRRGEWNRQGPRGFRGMGGYGGGMGGMGGMGADFDERRWDDEYQGRYPGGGAWNVDEGRTSFGRGEHAGRGPKGWQPSSDRLRDEICERMSEHEHLDASEIEVQVEGGEVTLTGSVPNRLQKRLAEDLAMHARGVRDVHNRLSIRHEDRTRQTRDTTASHVGTQSPGMGATTTGGRRNG